MLVDSVASLIELEDLIILIHHHHGLITEVVVVVTRELNVDGGDNLHDRLGTDKVLVQDRAQHFPQHSPRL